ncbi:conserved hypothetical protein [metagenome]|uniref:YdhG-like domain-containing protein n=1 Tax=metagenome TaxID=256318 RepID=A0A2P2BWJ9_9ZZZZ
MSSFDDYLDSVADAADRAALQHVREVVLAVEPTAEEGTSYAMPAFRFRSKPLLGVTAAKTHLSLFPFSPAVIDAVRHRLDGHRLSKGTVRFTAETPVPDEILLEIVRLRRAEITG